MGSCLFFVRFNVFLIDKRKKEYMPAGPFHIISWCTLQDRSAFVSVIEFEKGVCAIHTGFEVSIDWVGVTNQLMNDLKTVLNG